jgi:hypothetical protein
VILHGGSARRPRLVGSLLLAAALASPSLAAAEPSLPKSAPEAPPGSDDYAIDPETGHPFRVRFNPARRVWAAVSAAALPLSDEPEKPTFEGGFGIWLRSLFPSGQGSDLVVWQIEHRWVTGWVWPFYRIVEGIPAMDAALYSASMHRHDEAPSAVLPFTPPVSVPFPFDLGFEMEIGRVFVPGLLPVSVSSGAPAPMLRVGVLRASIFLDPWRSGVPGRSFEIGVGARYDVDPIASPTLKEARMLHRIAPMTATSLRFRFQSMDGLTVLDLRGDFIPHWTSERTWKIMALAAGRVERTLIAINDQPIAAVLEGNYRRSPESEDLSAVNDVRISLGLMFNIEIP